MRKQQEPGWTKRSSIVHHTYLLLELGAAGFLLAAAGFLLLTPLALLFLALLLLALLLQAVLFDRLAPSLLRRERERERESG
jgi:uncharacterized membrane protein YciS (DUF1049 family)